MPNAIQTVYFVPAKNHRFLLLDALRGIAALFIVAWHLPTSTRTFLAAPNGLLAVDFFFCLSGFVIALSYEKRLSENLSLRAFFVARWIRLYPIYFLGSAVGLVSAILVEHAALARPTPFTHWLLLTGLAIFMLPTRFLGMSARGLYPLDDPAWSLFYEIAANIAFALLIKLRVAKSLLFLLFSLVSAAILFLYITHGGTIDVGTFPGTFALGFARIGFSFAAGVLVYRLYRVTKHAEPSLWSRWLTPSIVTLSLMLLLISPLRQLHTELFRLVIVVLCFSAIVYCGAFAKSPHRLHRLCTSLGELSYPIYLLHNPCSLPSLATEWQRSRVFIPACFTSVSVPSL